MKTLNRVLCLLIVVLSLPALAGDTITREDLDRLKLLTQNEDFRVKQNAISNNQISELVIDRDYVQDLDRHFSHVIKRGQPTNQERSGRCWLFAGLNVLRFYTANELGLDNFEFSENYLFFFHKLELANHLINQSIFSGRDLDGPSVAWLMRNGLGDGGYWDMFTALIDKYGLVPRSAMAETKHSNNTREFNTLFENLVKRHIARMIQFRADGRDTKFLEVYRKYAAMPEIYQFLALTLGTPPDTFEWRYVKKGSPTKSVVMTPKQFYDRYARGIVSNKVHLLSDPTLEYNKSYTLDALKNVSESKDWPFFNVPMDVLKKATIDSVKNGHPVWFGADVMKYADIKEGVLDTQYYNYQALFGMPLEGDQTQRLLTFASVPTHAMVFMGMDLVGGKPVKWLVENSWGSGGREGGFLIMTDQWMDEYVFDAIVERTSVPIEVQREMGKEAVQLPIWHHLWQGPAQ